MLLSCKEAAQLISQSMDHPLPTRWRVALKFHLFICRFCTRYQRQLLFMREVLRRRAREIDDEESLASTSLSAETRQRLKEALRRRK